MALPLNLNTKINRALISSWYLNLCIFSLKKCEWIATEKISQKIYIFERKAKLNLSLNFALSFRTLGVNKK